MASEEVVDLFDEQGRRVGTAPRREVRRDNLRHGATGIAVVNGAGEVFVHRRADDKDVYPGRWDFLAGGVLQHGERPEESAARELSEELGINGAALHPLGEGDYADDATRYHAFLYLVRWDGEVSFTDHEVAEGGWWTVELLRERIQLSDWSFMPDSVALMGHRLDELTP
ncbi:NUDIX domain-containing protein [Luteococcus sanguinis]|uniref:NUDIX domain-containing protein n=1 Tax=Luteococcus sanguinis TaxID=174038 RepID=A0ABW1X1L5_9ACTN